MERDLAVPGNVTLYPEDWKIIDEVAERTRLRSRSGAMRFIIAEYQRLKESTPTPPQRIPEPESV